MSWVTGNRYLTEAEMRNNAQIVCSFLAGRGWSLNAIAGLLGNMQSESTINPGIWQSLNSGNTSGGYGLVQWTPSTNYTNWATQNGYAWDNGNAQLKWIDEETVTTGQWIATASYNMSFNEFKVSSKSAEYLASAFLKNFERAGVEVESERRKQAKGWFTYLTLTYTPFVPRMNDTGIEGSFYWYDDNPFYKSGYGLPNCTCYAWGRFWEISDLTKDGSNKPSLPTGNAGDWFPNVLGYDTGSVPQLGAVICWSREGEAGHVAIVEQINEDGSIVTSNSAWGGQFFYTQTLTKESGYTWSDNYVFQGFIYNPYASSDIPPSYIKTKKKKKFNFVLFNRNRLTRLRNGGYYD